MVTRHVSEGRAALRASSSNTAFVTALIPHLRIGLPIYATAEPCQFAPAKLLVYGTTSSGATWNQQPASSFVQESLRREDFEVPRDPIPTFPLA